MHKMAIIFLVEFFQSEENFLDKQGIFSCYTVVIACDIGIDSALVGKNIHLWIGERLKYKY